MNENEKKLFNMVLKKLMNLPAYKLNKKYREIFKEYKYAELNKLIKRKTLKEYKKKNNHQDTIIKSVVEIYQRPNQLKILWFSFNSLSSNDKIVGSIAIISFICGGFFIKGNSPLLILFDLICVLIFTLSFLLFYSQAYVYYSNINSTFSIINSRLKYIEECIVDFRYFIEYDLHKKANIILKNIIEEDISRIDDAWKKNDIYHIVFALLTYIIVAYMSGDILIEGIKWIANILGFENFESIKELNLETLLVFLLFSSLGIRIGTGLSKYIINSGSEQRKKKLNRSLAIVENYLEKLNSSSIQDREVVSLSRKTSLKYEQNLATAIRKYQKGEISMEKAAQIANLNRRNFLEVLARKKIDVFTVDFDDLDRELERG